MDVVRGVGPWAHSACSPSQMLLQPHVKVHNPCFPENLSNQVPPAVQYYKFYWLSSITLLWSHKYGMTHLLLNQYVSKKQKPTNSKNSTTFAQYWSCDMNEEWKVAGCLGQEHLQEGAEECWNLASAQTAKTLLDPCHHKFTASFFSPALKPLVPINPNLYIGLMEHSSDQYHHFCFLKWARTPAQSSLDALSIPACSGSNNSLQSLRGGKQTFPLCTERLITF